MDHAHPYAQDMHYVAHHEPWMHQPGYHSQHQSPVQEYPGFSYATSPQPLDHPYTNPVQPLRPTHHQLQPLITTTTWPSVLATQHTQPQHYAPPPPPPLPPPPPPPSHTAPPAIQPAPSSANSSMPPVPPQPTTTPRRTLTDTDRRKMCEYHEAHPTKKQTEIGEIFGVERSTVSKVLRQKEKYLHQDDGSRSPIKRTKQKYPDIDRTLAKWVANQQSKGVKLTDDQIRSQARFFWAAAGNGAECPVKIDSPAWLEKFKLKNNLGGTRPKRRSSTDLHSAATSPPSPAYDDPMSPEESLSRAASPGAGDTRDLRRQSSASAVGSLDGLGIRGTRMPFHSQSNTSLSSAYTDANTAAGSPALSPEAITSASSATSYFPGPPLNSSVSSAPRSRSATFATSAPGDPYISPPQSADTSSPKFTSTAAVFDGDMPPPSATAKYYATHGPHGLSPKRRLHKTSSTPSFAPAYGDLVKPLGSGTTSLSPNGPSLDEARKGLEVTLDFLHSTPDTVEPHELVTLRNVMHTLQVQTMKLLAGPSLPGGLHRIPEQEFGRGEDGDVFRQG